MAAALAVFVVVALAQPLGLAADVMPPSSSLSWSWLVAPSLNGSASVFTSIAAAATAAEEKKNGLLRREGGWGRGGL